MEKKRDHLDAGLASLDHYQHKLPPWRYKLRQALLPFVRWETPYCALLQERMRNPVLDSYFALTANLGTHTAFMVVLPILFWCGYATMGRGMVHILAAGVFLSGFVKDLLCLPRPLSPPLTRITMSGSAALEYGFPSTHSTNAVSVAYYAIYMLKYGESDIPQGLNNGLQTALYFYAGSIVLGRLYCGMHGFFDVIFGSALGALIGAVQCRYGLALDEWVHSGSITNPFIVAVVLLVLVRLHPEPADDCPCFDDSVAFAAVWLGCEFASWHFSKTPYSSNVPAPATAPFSLKQLGWFTTIARIMFGVLTIFIWRGVAKPTMLKVLPPLFRVFEQLGIDLPRRFFKPASQYNKIPRQRNDDNVIPSARDIPRLLANLRRRRAVSVGPQSEADAYEALAYRDKRRRDSMTKPMTPRTPFRERLAPNSYFPDIDAPRPVEPLPTQGRRRSLSLEEFRAQMGGGSAMLSPVAVFTPASEGRASQAQMVAQDEKELFANLEKPRVRYDVEVVTKLIVYAGIGFLAIEGDPVLFHLLGWSL